jgi:hypothetical protein
LLLLLSQLLLSQLLLLLLLLLLPPPLGYYGGGHSPVVGHHAPGSRARRLSCAAIRAHVYNQARPSVGHTRAIISPGASFVRSIPCAMSGSSTAVAFAGARRRLRWRPCHGIPRLPPLCRRRRRRRRITTTGA